MANFKQWLAKKTITGPGRLAVTVHTTPDNDAIQAADPTSLASVMAAATYAFNTTPVSSVAWLDTGATEGGINITKGFDEQSYSHDLANDFKTEITGHSCNVQTNLAESGNIQAFTLAWMAQTSSTAISDGSKRGISARRVSIHRSLALVEVDDAGRLRVFYLRDVANTSGDSGYQLNTGSMHTLPLNLKGFQDSSKSNEEFGFIMFDNAFGT